MAGSGGGVPGPVGSAGVPGFSFAGVTSFILGNEAALTLAASVELRVEDLGVVEPVRRAVVVFARPRAGGAERGCSGDVSDIARLSSLPGSVPTKPGGGGGAREAIASRGAAGDAVWG